MKKRTVDHYNWCAVPDKGYDAVLFGGMAVVVAALLQGKYAALWTLIAGTISGTHHGTVVKANIRVSFSVAMFTPHCLTAVTVAVDHSLWVCRRSAASHCHACQHRPSWQCNHTLAGY